MNSDSASDSRKAKEIELGGKRTIQLPEELCARAEQKSAPAFGGLEPLLTLVLTELLRDDVEKLDQAEEKMIQARLRDLGYI